MECLNGTVVNEMLEVLTGRLENYLRTCGHAPSTIGIYISIAQRILAELSNDELFEELQFALARLPSAAHRSKSTRAVLHHLQRMVGEIQEACLHNRVTPVTQEIAAFDRYMSEVCGLAQSTRECRQKWVAHFLEERYPDGIVSTDDLEPTCLMQHVARQSRGYSAGTTAAIACSLRSYVKFLQFRGDVDPRLRIAIPSPPNRRLKDYPATMSESQISSLIGALDRTRPDGKRDYAMLLCMLTLGLRCSEVVEMGLTDIDWRKSILVVRRGKNRVARQLPLTKICGSAIAEYLKHGRPTSSSRRIFVRHATPTHKDMVSETVRGAMRRAYERAGLPKQWTGTHILRHTAATRMLNCGASLKEIADVLGHQSIDTTAIYTKVDTTSLSTVCQPWPGDRP